MAARLERAGGVLTALEAALALEEEEGDVPAPVLVEHQVDTRRKQKLLLSQLRVLRLLLGVIENPGLPPAPAGLREAAAQARGRWQELKLGYRGALGALEGAVPPTLTQLGKGQRLLQRLRAVLGARTQQQEELQVKIREATERRDELLRRVQERRRGRLGRQGALRSHRGAATRAGASCRLYQALSGVRVLLPPSGTPELELELELELGPPPGPSPGSLPPLRLSHSPRGGVRVLGPPLPLPPPLGPGLLELQRRCWDGWGLWEEVTHLRDRFALDWQPELGLLRVLGGPRGAETLWTLELDPGYPQSGGVRLLPPPEEAPPIPSPPDPPTLTRWLELLVGLPKPRPEGPHKSMPC
ncbi:ZW10 interactor isoform X2 [Manacus candei]|uniref:ZW10 interactor isoform X2 n=1 Tax=Manacus candei TaxID=415023 RepID=UPI002226C59D|nr:ZW10 interactor isoform X2 [Manacus candei]